MGYSQSNVNLVKCLTSHALPVEYIILINRTFARLVGCDTHIAGLKDCLMSKNVSDIIKAQANITTDVTSTSHLFLPVIDHHFLQGEIVELYQTHLFIPPE